MCKVVYIVEEMRCFKYSRTTKPHTHCILNATMLTTNCILIATGTTFWFFNNLIMFINLKLFSEVSSVTNRSSIPHPTVTYWVVFLCPCLMLIIWWGWFSEDTTYRNSSLTRKDQPSPLISTKQFAHDRNQNHNAPASSELSHRWWASAWWELACVRCREVLLGWPGKGCWVCASVCAYAHTRVYGSIPTR